MAIETPQTLKGLDILFAKVLCMLKKLFPRSNKGMGEVEGIRRNKKYQRGPVPPA